MLQGIDSSHVQEHHISFISSLCLFSSSLLSVLNVYLLQRPEKAGKVEDNNRRRADEDQLVSIFLPRGLLCITGK